MTEERFAQIKAKHFNIPAVHRSIVVGHCLAEIERLRAAIKAMKFYCSCDLDEHGYCDCGAAEQNARIDAILEAKHGS